MSAGRAIRLLLVDDDPLVTAGLRAIFGSAEDLEVVASVGDGDEVVDAVHAHRPDVVLMDVRMPRVDGVRATAAVRALRTPPRVVVLTTFDSDGLVLEAVRAGAEGFLLKTTGPADMIAAVRSVAAGHGALSPQSAAHVLTHLAGGAGDGGRDEAAALVGGLTGRERDVVLGVWAGRTNREIAAELFLSEQTVKTHLASAQRRLGVFNRTEVAVLVERSGLAQGD